MNGKRSYRRRRATKRPTKRIVRKSGRSGKAFTKAVKAIIHRQVETKGVFDYGVNQPITTTTLATPDYKNVCPVIYQGLGGGQRIGNQVRVTGGYIKGHVNILPYSASTNTAFLPIYVKIWICSYKPLNTFQLSNTTIASTLFDFTNSTGGLQGNMLDMDLPINKDVWTPHASKTIKLGAATTNANPPVNTLNYFDNSSMSAPFSFNIGKYLKGVLKYDDVTQYATNKNLFMFFQAVTASGNTVGAGAQQPAEFHYSTRINYEDA